MSRSVSALTTILLLTALPAIAQQAKLPDGPGKEVAEAKCNSCHALPARVGNGYDVEGWRTVLRMMSNHGVPLTQNEISALMPYLIKNWPEKERIPAVIVDGPHKVTMQSWPAGTPGSRPHDPLAGADGSLWYTGQMTNTLGRVDPKTNKVREYPLKTAHSGPHGLVEDKSGNIWYTGNGGALIGNVIWYSESLASPNTVVRFDPKTQKFQSWAIPGGGKIVRNTDVTKNGDFVLANSLANQVTLVRISK